MEAVALSRGVMEEDTAAKTDSVRGLSTRGDMHECDPAIARTSVGVATCLLTAIYICRYKCSLNHRYDLMHQSTLNESSEVKLVADRIKSNSNSQL